MVLQPVEQGHGPLQGRLTERHGVLQDDKELAASPVEQARSSRPGRSKSALTARAPSIRREGGGRDKGDR